MNESLKALFILSHHDFYDDEYFVLKDILEKEGIKTEVCSTHMAEAQGRFKNVVAPDFLLRDTKARDYDVFIFVGGEGAAGLCQDMDAQILLKDILVERKVLVMIGEAVPMLYYANVADGRKVTTLENLKYDLETGGAYYTGRNVEQDRDLITGYDDKSIGEVSKAIIRALGWQKKVVPQGQTT